MALCTKPPSPFVGEAGRSMRSPVTRPCEGDIASVRLVEVDSVPYEELESDVGGSKR